MRKVDPSWPAVSASIHHSVGVWPLLINDSTSILEWDPPTHALLKARAWPVGSAHMALDVRRVESGCTVTMTEDAVEGPGRLIVPEPVRSAAILPAIRRRCCGWPISPRVTRAEVDPPAAW